MFYWENEKITDIANTMDMSSSAVESLLRRTRSKLQHLLDTSIVGTGHQDAG